MRHKQRASFASTARVGLIQALAAFKLMRALAFLLLTLAAISSPCIAARRQPPYKVLFVGNSLTYVGNTPAVFDALAAANDIRVTSDMIVRGGATLTERAIDGTVARALSQKHYTAVVQQERGGDLMCSFGPDSCVQSRQAIKTLTVLARQAGAKVFLLGTFQGLPEASKNLVTAESAAAVEAGIPYVEVSQKLQMLRTSAPDLNWLAPDGMHPGAALALLNATVIYESLLHRAPKPVAIRVTAPIYGSKSGLVEELRKAEAPPPLANTPSGIIYPAAILQKLLRLAGSQAGS